MRTQNGSKKNFQFACRIPLNLKKRVQNRLLTMGCTSLSEYVRLIIINDVEGFEGLIGQSKEV